MTDDILSEMGSVRNYREGLQTNAPLDQTHLAHDFSHIYTPAPALASSRYNRQMLIPSISLLGQQRISAARILIVGLGGLGSPASLYLAGAGVGKLGLLDDDDVELSNLHRQIVHREDSVKQGLPKVQSAKRACEELNGECKVVGHEMRLAVGGSDGAKVMEVFDGYDIVLDCTDNPATRYLISDLCVLLSKTLVSGAAQRLEGQVLLLNYAVPPAAASMDHTARAERGPCYRCVFPTPPSPDMVLSCGEIGILGPVVGTIGTLMASETLRLIVRGLEETRKPTMLLYNAWPADPRSMFRTIGLRGARKDCLACGKEDVLKEKGLKRITKDELVEGRVDYVAFCGVSEDVRILKSGERMSAQEFLHLTAREAGTENHQRVKRPVIVDTREPHEVEMGPKIGGSINIPLTKILRQGRSIEEMEALLLDGKHDSMLFVCQRGNDSQIAARKMLEARRQRYETKAESGADGVGTMNGEDSRIAFIGDIAGGFAAIEKVIRTSSVRPP